MLKRTLTKFKYVVKCKVLKPTLQPALLFSRNNARTYTYARNAHTLPAQGGGEEGGGGGGGETSLQAALARMLGPSGGIKVCNKN